ncbi:MCA1 [Symbiodinium natans]|uniref:MCA1 protein n=1 Tax=Symbiodinium natans TaxID=878477 RepID=A0A812K062_9DINO|nr:MCA1 [Symbiodinium natans]
MSQCTRGSVVAAAAGALLGLVFISASSSWQLGDVSEAQAEQNIQEAAPQHAAAGSPVPRPLPAPPVPALPVPAPPVPTRPTSQGSLQDEVCVADQLTRPPPVVYGADGTWMEVSFLNGDLSGKGYKTSPMCQKPWTSDVVGRPIIDTTATLVQRAIRVGHPKNGMLNPKSDVVIPKPCARPVPKILHFIWLCSPLSESRASHVQGFAIKNPNYRILFWTDTEIPPESKMVLENGTSSRPAGAIELKDAYSEAQSFQSLRLIRHLDTFHENNRNPGVCALKSHFWRLEAPLKYGGIYIDMDHVATRGFDEVGGAELWRWPFVTHKVCGANIGNHIFSGDKGSGFLDFAIKVIMERCEKLSSCNVLEGTGPPPFAMSVLRYNASDMAFIGDQFFGRTGIAAHKAEHSWR